MRKLKDFFDTAKYRRKYNTLENKYNSLKENLFDRVLKIADDKDELKNSIESINKTLKTLDERVIKIEHSKEKRIAKK